tara:strand:+ start:2145 stop:2834 length:690 start_codon:yes stop_codon:yes gene_type:complete
MATKSTTTKKVEQTTFEKLSAINVNKFVEKKNNLTYLSWAFAWSETKKVCPDATYTIVKDEQGNPYVYDEMLGFMCETNVTIEGETLSMWLPVMDSKNQAMRKVPYSYTTRYGEKQVAGATSFDINKTLMRCLVKNLAMFGMGIYIYAGEDMPVTSTPSAPSTPSVPSKTKETETESKPKLDITNEKWSAMANFCVENKALGFKKLCDKVGAKYTLTAAAKNEIKNLIK